MRSARFAAMVVIVAALSFASGRATTYIALDGTWWQGMPSDSKPDVAAGMQSAFAQGWISGAGYEGGAITAAIGKQTHDMKSAIALVGSIENRTVRDHAPTFSRTYGYYAAAISDFYESRSGVEDVRVSEVMSCLADHPTFSCDEVAQPRSTRP